MDLVMLDHEGYLAFFERFEKAGQLMLTPGARIFACTNGADYNSWNGGIKNGRPDGLLRLNATPDGQSGRRKLVFTDWDGDGDMDLIVNGLNAALYENLGETGGRVLFKSRGGLSKDRLAGHTNSPAVADINNDGVDDLIVGAEDGHLYLFRRP